MLGMEISLHFTLSFFEAMDFFPPLRMLLFLQLWKNFFNPLLHIPLYGIIRTYVLPDFRLIDVYMNDFTILGIPGNISGGTIGKTNSQSKQNITFRLGFCRHIASVHSHQTKTQGMRVGKCCPSHNTDGNRNIQLLCQGNQLFLRLSRRNTPAGIN